MDFESIYTINTEWHASSLVPCSKDQNMGTNASQAYARRQQSARSFPPESVILLYRSCSCRQPSMSATMTLADLNSSPVDQPTSQIQLPTTQPSSSMPPFNPQSHYHTATQTPSTPSQATNIATPVTSLHSTCTCLSHHYAPIDHP